MDKKQVTYSVEVPLNDPEAMKEFNNAMAILQDEHFQYVRNLSEKLGVSESCASDVVYLRGRSRWTQEAEDELIRRDKTGEERPNIFDYPN